MSKRRKTTKFFTSADDYDGHALETYFEAPKGEKPRGKDRRKRGAHKTAYWDT